MNDKIKKFKFWCNNILPLVYDDSLSYYEALCKFVAKLNETIEQVNALTQAQKDFLDLISKIVDDFTKSITDTLNQWQGDINNQIAQWQAVMNQWDAYIKSQLSDAHLQSLINLRINQLLQDGTFTDLIYNSKQFQTWLAKQENNINNYFDNISQSLTDVYSITKVWENPTTTPYPKKDVNPININLANYDFVNLELLYGVTTQSVFIAKGADNVILSTSTDPVKNYLIITNMT